MTDFLIGYNSDRGAVHPINQDSIFLKSFSEGNKQTLIAGLFDGMGGHSEGERVSGASAQAISSWTDSNKALLLEGSQAEIINSLTTELEILNDKIRAYNQRANIESGTTAAVLIIGQGCFMSCNIGDSRIYHIERRSHKQISEDHSLAANLIKAGLLSESQAKTYAQKNVLTQALGLLEKITPSFSAGYYSKGDAFLLCSDGFYGELSNAEIQNLYYAGNDTHMISRQLATTKDLVISRGETDNISSILIKVTSEG